MRIKSWWCSYNIFKKTTEHKKCGGKVYKYKGLGTRDEAMIDKLDDGGFLEKICQCSCHKK